MAVSPSSPVSIRCGLLHDVAPPVGSLLKVTAPALSTAAHSCVDTHATLVKGLSSTMTVFHSPAPPVGLVLVKTLPASSTATHNVVDGHDMSASSCEGSTAASTQPRAQPPLGTGVVDATMRPPSIPAHKSVPAHDTAVGCGLATKMSPRSHERSASSVDATVLPPSFIARQKPSGAQLIAFSFRSGSIHDELHLASTLAAATASPSFVTPTHSVVAGHSTSVGEPSSATSSSCVHSASGPVVDHRL